MRILEKIFKRKRKSEKRVTKTPSNASTYKEFLEHDYFDRVPKTDYTYSRSPSYSRRYLNSSYVKIMPNMSRRKFRSKISVMESRVADENYYLSSSEDEEELGVNSEQDMTPKIYKIEKTVYEEGMLLRSGTGLKNARTLLEDHEMKSKRKSLPAGKSAYRDVSGSKSHGRYSSQSDRLTSMDKSLQHSSFVASTESNRTSVRKTLVKEFEESSAEKGMKEMHNESEKRKLLRRRGRNVSYMYGLDSDMSESESEIFHHGASASNSRNLSQSYLSSQNVENSHSEEELEEVTTVTTTSRVVTTVIAKISKAVSPVTTPVWNAVGEPVWKVIGRPVYSAVSSTVSQMLSLVKYVTLNFILLDTWLLSRRRARYCCFCLPLLLLLPLLLVSGAFFPVEKITTLPLYLSTYFERPVVVSQDGIINTHELKEEIQRIVINLQRNTERGLTREDVEKIVDSKLGSGLAGLKLNVDEERNKQIAAQMRLNNEQAEKLIQLHAAIVSNISALKEKLADEKAVLIGQGTTYQESTSQHIVGLQADLSALQSKLDGVELSQQMLQLQMKNCCKNDSFLAAFVQNHVNTILSQMMSGKKSGNSDQDAFTAWLHSNYVSRDELDNRMTLMAKEITDEILSLVKQRKPVDVVINGGGSELSEQLIRGIVDEALLKYSADKIGLPDFALESSGGSIVSTRCSETYHKRTAQYRIFGLPLWYASNSPRTVIQPEVHPGSCWAFQGTHGFLVIELSTIITPTGFTLEHIPKSVAPEGRIDSATKEFMVLGLENEADTQGTLLGNYTYNEDGKPLQFFPLELADSPPFKYVELRILGNHGNPLFTCLYRFRVHGVPYRTS